MTTKITHEQAVKESLEMWKWIYENPNKSKKDYLDKFKNSAKILHDCYFCEYAKVENNKYPDCDNCPAYGLWGTELFLDDVYCEARLYNNPELTSFDKYVIRVGNKNIEGVKQAAEEMVELIKKIDV